MAKVKTSIAIDEEIHRRVKRLAQDENRSYSNMLESLVREKLMLINSKS